MRFWYDTEFIEDGKTIELISIGIVAEDGDEYYAVNADAPWKRIKKHPWLMANVVPHLPKTYGDARNQQPKSWLFNIADPTVKPRLTIATEVRQFLTAHNGPVELWGYYSAYDHVLLAQLFGPMIALPKGIPMWTNDVQQVAAARGLEHCLPAQTGIAHNALDDARWTKAAWEYLHTARPVGITPTADVAVSLTPTAAPTA